MNGALVLLVLATGAVLWGHGPLRAAGVVVVGLLALFRFRAALRGLARPFVLLAILGTAGAVAAVAPGGPAQGSVVGLRLASLAVLAGALAGTAGTAWLSGGPRGAGGGRFTLGLGLAFNLLPVLAGTVRDVWFVHRSRSGGLGRALVGLPRLAEVLLAQTGRLADEAVAAAALRGHEGTIRPSGTVRAALPLVVVTGGSGEGKTRTVEAVAAALRRAGVPVAGVVQPGVARDGRRAGFRVRDLATGEEAPLATFAGREEGEAKTAYRFHPEGFALARCAMERVPAGGVLLVDEVGPLELRGRGHMPVLARVLASGRPAAAVLSVRRLLVPSALAAFRGTAAVIVDAGSAPDPAGAVIEALERAGVPVTAGGRAEDGDG